MTNVETDVTENLEQQQSQHTTQYAAFCQKSCMDQTELHSQMIEDNNSNEDLYQCNICLKTFTVLARLTRHYRTHTGEKPFQCEFCSKSFSVKENLSVHRRIHTKERPYKCEICSRAFEHSGKLHRHMRIHTGERPHKCTICEKTFIQSGQLVIHMRTHTGEKPYVCNTCKKGFTCSKQLKVHSRTHTGEKPYSCDICGKSFGYNHVLKLHQVAHYGEKVYKCTICKNTFTSKKSMEMHIKNHSDNTNNHGHQSSTQESTIICEMKQPEQEIDKICYKNSIMNSEKENETLRYVLQQPKLENQQSSNKHLYNLLTHPHDFKQDVTSIALKSPVHVSVPVVYDRVEDTISNSNQQHQPLTPPNSNSSSPAGSPAMLEVVDDDQQHNLPLRKRSKMFLKSFETTAVTVPAVQLSNNINNPRIPIRYNTVIHYAKAS